MPGVLPLIEAEPLLYFCDESHIRTSDFMAVGGLAVRPSRANLIATDLARLKQECGVAEDSEVKWSKCKKRYKSIHAAFIDYLFDAIEAGHVHLHVRFSPLKEYDHSVSGARMETDTISKAFYQLLLHRAGRFYGGTCKLLIRPDDGACTSYLPRMLAGINSDVCAKFDLKARPIADIAPRSSHQEPMLQLLDVALGALTAARNGNHENGVLEERKKLLVGQVLARGDVKAIEKSDPLERRDFNIWNVTPMWKKGAIPTR